MSNGRCPRIWPNEHDGPVRTSPAVCLLDTGVNRAHILIEPTLAEDDMAAVKPEWGIADSPQGHGTGMAGLALFGDLIPHLTGNEVTSLAHRLESVKILPPRGFDPTEERLYGAITKQAVALPETRRPNRPRVFCLAVTNDDRSGIRPTTWSSAIDQEAAGVTELDEKAPPRLFIVSTGNAPNPIEVDQIADPDSLEIEDPAQAWNAITVGGYTDLVNIHEPQFEGFSPLADAGDISPYTRTSTLWLQGKSPFKPDIVMEAGNRAVSPSRSDAYDADSLALLSTGPNTDLHPLVSFRATSAATAQAARLAARLVARFPDYWPETIRALIIHGADWTPRMASSLKAASSKAAAYLLLRRYGHGVPTFERAAASARNHLALVAQTEIQPMLDPTVAFLRGLLVLYLRALIIVLPRRLEILPHPSIQLRLIPLQCQYVVPIALLSPASLSLVGIPSHPASRYTPSIPASPATPAPP